MVDDYRDERGRLKPGAPPLNKGKQAPTQPADTPPFDGDFDDAIIYIAETYGRGRPRETVGLLGVVEDLRRGKPTEFASYLRQAYANRKQKQDNNTVRPGVIVNFTTAPSGMSVDADGKLIEPSDARADWVRKTGMEITTDEPPPAQPVLVQPPELQDDDDDDDEPEPPPRHRDGIDMNDMLRSIPKPKWRKPDW